MMKLSAGVKGLLIANVILFAISFMVSGLKEPMFDWFALYFPENDQFKIWQFITSMFMHGGPAHLFFNMFALFSFGSVLEARWGIRRFMTFYFIAGLGAGIIYTLVNYIQFNDMYNELENLGLSAVEIKALLNTGYPGAKVAAQFTAEQILSFRQIYFGSAVGASGAIYGVLVAFGMMYPNAKLMLIFLPVPVAAKYFIPALVGLDLILGVTGTPLFGGFGPGIAHFAHIGGALVGFLLMTYWSSKER